MNEPVRDQYEAYPYPERDPADEAKRLISGSPSDLHEINHYVFGGRLDTAKPFRALVAGGGTGDGTIMLAQMLAWRDSPAEIVYLDLSEAALEVTRARAAARGLANLRFVRGSLLDLPNLGLGAFDYIDCCGVLHHLPEPAAGLAILAGIGTVPTAVFHRRFGRTRCRRGIIRAGRGVSGPQRHTQRQAAANTKEHDHESDDFLHPSLLQNGERRSTICWP